MLPPAGNGTKKRTGLSGNACAHDGDAAPVRQRPTMTAASRKSPVNIRLRSPCVKSSRNHSGAGADKVAIRPACRAEALPEAGDFAGLEPGRSLAAGGPMVPFFVQIKCQLGKSYEVANRLADAEIASEIYSTAGEFDLLIKVYVDGGTDIGHFVNEKVQTIPGIQDTRTIITFKAF
jgi:DNA-binding Lrp family transcriptional regulator